MSDLERSHLQQEVKGMFHHAYDSYMLHAFPKDELLPISCTGSDTLGSYSLTLIDSLDALLILGNRTEFQKAVLWVGNHVDFDINVNVSVFETNIRVLGGLLSAHLLAVEAPQEFPDYNNRLLDLAVDLATRLLPAFETPTRIPYGTVNLRYGVPQGETPVASLAGAGTLIMEFGLLSRITGNPIYEHVAHEALMGLWERRSMVGLLGGHINNSDGVWTDGSSGIGAGADSFFEYLLKGAFLLDEAEYYLMFEEAYGAVMDLIYHEGWYFLVEMNQGKMMMPYFDALSAFWPAVQVLFGDVAGAVESVVGFVRVWHFFGYTPEKANLISGSLLEGQKSYPLRPELVESLYYLHRATGDPVWLHLGKGILFALQNRTRVECGFAGVADVESYVLEDHMNSFFLAETLKYLYLLFDDGSNFVHARDARTRYLFNTEGHILPIKHEFRGNSRRPLGGSEGEMMYSSCDRPHFMEALGVPWLDLSQRPPLILVPPPSSPPPPPQPPVSSAEAEQPPAAVAPPAAAASLNDGQEESSSGSSDDDDDDDHKVTSSASPPVVVHNVVHLDQIMQQSQKQRQQVEQRMAEMRQLIGQLEVRLRQHTTDDHPEADVSATREQADAEASSPTSTAANSAAAEESPAGGVQGRDFKRSAEFQRMRDIARMIEERSDKPPQQQPLHEAELEAEPRQHEAEAEADQLESEAGAIVAGGKDDSRTSGRGEYQLMLQLTEDGRLVPFGPHDDFDPALLDKLIGLAQAKMAANHKPGPPSRLGGWLDVASQLPPREVHEPPHDGEPQARQHEAPGAEPTPLLDADTNTDADVASQLPPREAHEPPHDDSGPETPLDHVVPSPAAEPPSNDPAR